MSFLKINRQQGITVVLFLFYVSTLISQSAMDLFSTIFALLVLIYTFSFKEINFNLAKDFKFEIKTIVIWIGVVLAGFILNISNSPPWLIKIQEFKWLIIMFMIAGYLLKYGLTLKQFNILFISLFVVSLHPVLVYLFKYDPIYKIDYGVDGFIRMGGLLNNPMTYAHLYTLFFMIAAGVIICIWNKLSKSQRYKSAVLLTLIGASVILTFTRGVWISLSAAIITIAFLKNKKLGFAITFILVAVFSSLYFSSENFKGRIEHAANYNQNYDNQRLVLWTTNFEIFKDHPLFGIGYGENARRLREYYDRLNLPKDQFEGHAHNQFIHFLAGTGVFGLLVYLIFSFYFLFHALQNYLYFSQPGQNNSDSIVFKQGLSLGAIGALIHFHIGGLTEANFEHTKMRYSLAFILALILWLKLDREKNPVPTFKNKTNPFKLVNWF